MDSRRLTLTYAPSQAWGLKGIMWTAGLNSEGTDERCTGRLKGIMWTAGLSTAEARGIRLLCLKGIMWTAGKYEIVNLNEIRAQVLRG